MTYKNLIPTLLIFILFTGCIPNNIEQVQKEDNLSIIEKQKEANLLYIQEALADFYQEWKNVKYKFGGESKKGIDCSAFTQRVFKEKFNLEIPRTTRTQVKIGETVKKSELELGDLIFFKTGKRDRHVGIYIGEGKFMHASIKGVKITNLDKPFYKKSYWVSKRVINQNPPYIASTTGI